MRQSIQELAMEFAIDSTRDRVATIQELTAQHDRYQEMAGRVGSENADLAISNARLTLNIMGIKTPNQH